MRHSAVIHLACVCSVSQALIEVLVMDLHSITKVLDGNKANWDCESSIIYHGVLSTEVKITYNACMAASKKYEIDTNITGNGVTDSTAIPNLCM